MKEKILNRFKELEKQMDSVGVRLSMDHFVEPGDWGAWASAVINLFTIAFGRDSDYYKNFYKIYDKFNNYESELEYAKGIFKSAKIDYESGFIISFERQISGEIFSDFILLAKTALSEKQKDVAAVLACAALEDALKKFASLNSLMINDKSMTEAVNLLKANGLVKGAQKTLLDTMPKIRNYAMHAEWDKITSEDVSCIIGFVEQFLLSNFS